MKNKGNPKNDVEDKDANDDVDKNDESDGKDIEEIDETKIFDDEDENQDDVIEKHKINTSDLDDAESLEEIVDLDKMQPKSTLETYKKLDLTRKRKFAGRIVDILSTAREKISGAKEKVENALSKYIYRTFETNKILKVLDKNDIYTIEDLRNCDKLKIGREIGFTNAEMREFVKYAEECANKRQIKYWDDLIPTEFKKFVYVKMADVQKVFPQHYIYLVTFAEPMEIVVPVDVVARSYVDVEDKPTMDSERVKTKTIRFEQAIYILPDEFERCMKFLNGGAAVLMEYDVTVPMTYASFVYKGSLTNNIPILKAIATSYEASREIDDYKHFLSHDLIMLKAMTAYVNHIKSNTNLSTEQIEYSKIELDAMQEQMNTQRQMRMHQRYFMNDGLLTPQKINEMYSSGSSQQQPQASSQGWKIGVGFVIVIAVIIIFAMVMR